MDQPFDQLAQLLQNLQGGSARVKKVEMIGIPQSSSDRHFAKGLGVGIYRFF